MVMTIVRLVLTGALIYGAVWLESKAWMTVLLALVVLAIELASVRVAALSRAVTNTIGAAAARIKERQEHRRMHGRK